MQSPRPTAGCVHFERPRPEQARRRGAAPAPPRDADDLPGPDLVAEPAAPRPRHRRPRACRSGVAATSERGEGGRHAARRGHRPGVRRAAPAARVLGRPVPAHLHRPGPGPRPDRAHLRRAGLGARRVGPGPDPQPARGPQGPPRADHGLHRPRPGGGEATSATGWRSCTWASCARSARPTRCTPRPAHPYTAALLEAVPEPDPDVPLSGRVADAATCPRRSTPPSGCRFRTRCPRAEERCAVEEPLLRPVVAPGGGAEHVVACHFPLVQAAEPADAAVTTAATAG